jgi:hypothetical protein
VPPNPRDPLLRYLRVQGKLDASLNRALARAARDAEMRVRALELGPPGVGARVRAAQLRGVLAAIRELQEDLWQNGIGPLITSSLSDAQAAAVKAGEVLDSVLFEALPPRQAEILRGMARATAEAGLRADAARQAVQLSRRVYRNASLMSGAVEQTIRAGIIQGLSARELAASVRHHIHPATPGGTSYAAKRLARTELNNAFHQRQIHVAQKPWVQAVHWNLSKSHPRKDKCDDYATQNRHDLGRGNWPKDDVPDKPHPHCLCFMTYAMQSEDEFLAGLAAYLRAA